MYQDPQEAKDYEFFKAKSIGDCDYCLKEEVEIDKDLLCEKCFEKLLYAKDESND